MALLKDIIAENGVPISYHRLNKVEIDPESNLVTFKLRSWGSRELFLQGAPFAWTWDIIRSTVGVYWTDLQGTLVGEAVLQGAVDSPDGDISLESAKATQWSYVKFKRAESIDSNLVTPFGEFQCSSEERKNITDAVMLAQTLNAAGQTVAIDWTLADNSVVSLNLEQMVTVGLLLGQKVQAAHAQARVLRTAIEAANTVEDVLAVVWQ